MEILIHVTLQVDADEPTDAVSFDQCCEAGVQAVTAALRQASRDGFTHEQAARLSVGLVDVACPVRQAFEDGNCPDCEMPIPAGAVEGDECDNCGHVFWIGGKEQA